MKELQALLVKHDFVFDHLNNCYLHIINICTAYIVATSTQVSTMYLDSHSLDGDDNANFDPPSPHFQTGPKLNEEFITLQPSVRQAWLMSLKHDPIKLIADIIHHIHASDARKQVFARIVQLCTKNDPKLCDAPPLQLIQHVRTQWDSVYLMLEHFHFLQKVGLDDP